MNIFYLSKIIEFCAKWHLDKHVVKMPTEYNQLLASVHHMTGSKYKPLYKLSHKNHPCAIWARTSLSNYIYLCNLCIAVCKEYTFRYGKIHKGQGIAEELFKNLPDIPDIGFTELPQAMPDIYKDKDTVEAYRAYYIFGKSHIHSWKNRPMPPFIAKLCM